MKSFIEKFEISKPFMLIILVASVLVAGAIFTESPYFKLSMFFFLAGIGFLSVVGYTNYANKEQSRSLSNVIPSWSSGWSFAFIGPVFILALLAAHAFPGQTGVYAAIGIGVVGTVLVLYLVTKKPKKKEPWGK